MKPIWIVDDDQSIRWVLEKALARENIPHKSFSNPNDVLNALDEAKHQRGMVCSRLSSRSRPDLVQKGSQAGSER